MANNIQNDPLDKISIAEFNTFRLHPIVPISDLTLLDGKKLGEYLPYWRRNNLVPFIPKGSWNVEVSFNQVIWLRILDMLRSFGYPLKKTQQVCDYLFKDAYFSDIVTQDLLKRKEGLLKKKLAQTLDSTDIEYLTHINRILVDPLLLYTQKIEKNHLTDLISWCIDNKEEAGILIFPDGNVLERRGINLVNHNRDNIDSSTPHIYIPIKHFLLEFLKFNDMESIIDSYMLNEKEKIVLREIRNQNISEIKITLNGKDILRIDSQEHHTISDFRAKEIRNILGLGNYEEITLSTRDKQILNFKKTKKKILSD